MSVIKETATDAPRALPAGAARLSQFRCAGCGYGASCRMAPERCPTCGGGAWEYERLARSERGFPSLRRG